MHQNTVDIPVFYGTFADLTRINLDFVNAKIVLYRGRAFMSTLKRLLSEEEFDLVYEDLKLNGNNPEIIENSALRRFAIIPINTEKAFLRKYWMHFYQLLLAIYPSDFSLLEEIHLHTVAQSYEYTGYSTYQFRTTGKNYSNNFLKMKKSEYRFFRDHFKNYFFSSLKLKYLKYMISVYSASFQEPNPIFRYISLIICLEIIVEGREQLSYRIKRNTAILCGTTVDNCTLIFNNVNQLYKLRSAILHGQVKPNNKHFEEYHSYLRNLVSTLIIELAVHNIPTVAELNQKITSLGFGQRSFISSNYLRLKHPLSNEAPLAKALPKY